MSRFGRFLAPALAVLSLLASPAALAGRGFAVRSYDGGNASDSGSGDRELTTGGATAAFWFPQATYDNAGGYVTHLVRLAVDGERKTWNVDPANVRSYTLEIVRRDSGTGRVWLARGYEEISFLYRLDPATNQVRRFSVPWRVTGLEVESTQSQVWLVGPARLALLDSGAQEAATPSVLVYPLPAGVAASTRFDSQRRLWLPSDSGLVMFPVSTRNWVTFPGVPEMIFPSWAEGDGVWGASGAQDKVYRWSPDAQAVTTFPLPHAAANWAGMSAAGAGRVDLASAYGPHFLSLDTARLGGDTTPTPAGSLGTVTTTASTLGVETRTVAPVVDDLPAVDRVVWVEDDRGRGLHARNGAGYTGLLYAGGGETFAGRAPVEWWRPVAGSFSASAVLPVVVEVRPNDPTSNFLTEVTLTNVDAAAAITLTLKTSSGSYVAPVSLAAGKTLVFPNVVTALRDRGAAIPAGDVAGTLTATFTNGSGKMSARVYTLFGAGAAFPAGSTTGSSYTSLDPQNEIFAFRKSVNGLKNTAAFRTNIALANLCGAAAPCDTIDVSADFYDDATGRQVGSVDFHVPPGEWRQVNAPLATFPDATGETFSVIFTPFGGGVSAYDAYATIIDNGNQDSAFVRATAVAGSSRQTLPVVVDAAGVGTRFTSECAITNTTNGTITADVAFTSVGTGNVVSEVLTLLPNRGVRYANAVDHFRQIAPDKVGADDFGPVRIVFRDYTTGFASARTVASNRTGFGLTALDPSSARPQARKRIVGLTQTSAFRTNLAVVHLGATTPDPEAPITLEVRIHDAAGALVGAPLTATLRPGRLFQWSGILATLGASGSGYTAVVDRIAGQDPFDAYVTVIDNVSSDPSFQRAE